MTINISFLLALIICLSEIWIGVTEETYSGPCCVNCFFFFYWLVSSSVVFIVSLFFCWNCVSKSVCLSAVDYLSDCLSVYANQDKKSGGDLCFPWRVASTFLFIHSYLGPHTRLTWCPLLPDNTEISLMTLGLNSKTG